MNHCFIILKTFSAKGLEVMATCPICMDRSVDDFDTTIALVNKNKEIYYFECRRCLQKACSFCALEHLKNNKNCPFCRYTGVQEGKSYVYFSRRGVRKIAWIVRSIISTWDDSETDSSDSSENKGLRL